MTRESDVDSAGRINAPDNTPTTLAKVHGLASTKHDVSN